MSLRKRFRRGGNIAVLAVFLFIALLAMVAFAVEIGYLCMARTQAQNAADSAAMAAAWELLEERQLQFGQDDGDAMATTAYSSSRATGIQYAGYYRVGDSFTSLNSNLSNNPDGDIVFGRLSSNGQLTTLGAAEKYNAVLVRVRRDAQHHGDLRLLFASVLGIDSAAIKAEAIAIFRDGVRGFRATPKTGNTSLLPFALHVDTWKKLLDGTLAGTTDDWNYNRTTEQLSPGSDGLLEVVFYPNRTTSGNFGTVKIGNIGGTSDLSAQIASGVSQYDLSFHGGSLELGTSTTPLTLQGDTGMSSGIKAGLNQIVGKPRTILLYSKVTGTGSNASYEIVGFAGVRIVDYWLDGKNWQEQLNHRIRLQPASVIDDAALPGSNSRSYHVYQPVVLAK